MTLKSIQVQKVLSLVLLFVGLSLNVFSQKKDVSLELYSVNRGLTQSTITSVFIDDRGLVWAGTCDGLNILDGDEIKVLRNDRISPNSLPHNTIRNITQDEDRSILIGTENGACSYNYVTSEFKRFNFDDKGIRDNMFKIVSTPDQLIFFCRDNFEAFYSRKNKTFNYVKKSFFEGNSSDCLFEGKYFWLTKIPFGLSSIVTKTAEMKDYPVPTGSGIVEINSIEIYNASNLLITSNKGVFLFNPKSGIYTEFKKLNEKSFFQKSVIRFLKRDKNNRYWAGVVGKGLFCFDKDWNILFSYTERYQFNGEVFDLKMPVCVAFDNAGNTWVGTDGNGLVKINPSLKKFSGIIPSDLIRSGITGDFILSVYKDENGNIYSGVLNSGLLIYNQRSGVKRIVSTRSDKFLTSDNITFIQPWHGDKLLLGTWVGLAVFDIRNGKIEKMNNVLEKKKIPVSCIYKVDEDFFLIGTTFGLYSLSGNIIKPKLFNRVSIFINNRRGKYF